MAISRKGNVGNEHAPASSPAVAHRRAKRTEWRMRGIKPNNKIIVVFPSSVLPSRCFGNPPSPEGGRLNRLLTRCHSGASVEKSTAIETARCIYAPAYPPAAALRREIHCNRNENNRTQIPQILVRTVTVPCPRRLTVETCSSSVAARQLPPRGSLNRLRTRIIINCCRSPILAFPLPGDSHGRSVPSE